LLQEKKPEILAMGSSRSFIYRREFFLKPDAFVNASFYGFDIDQEEEFIRNLPPDSGIKVILMTLDQSFFSSQFTKKVYPPNVNLSARISSFFTVDWRVLYYDYAQGKFTLSTFL
jgi:hypothetical protein